MPPRQRHSFPVTKYFWLRPHFLRPQERLLLYQDRKEVLRHVTDGGGDNMSAAAKLQRRTTAAEGNRL
jgi:hypothetical protein